MAGIGGDGLVPVSTLGAERFNFDEASKVLEGADTGDRYTSGMTVQLRLVEAHPVSGALRFELPEGPSHMPQDRKRVGWGTGVDVSVTLGCGVTCKQKKKQKPEKQ